MSEQRQTEREQEVTPAISCLAELPDGTVLEGVVKDLSDGGARVSTSKAGLAEGDEMQLIFVIQPDQRVVRRCQVKHVGADGKSIGLQFVSSPEPVDTNEYLLPNTCCGRRQDTPYCAYCGTRLRRAAAADVGVGPTPV